MRQVPVAPVAPKIVSSMRYLVSCSPYNMELILYEVSKICQPGGGTAPQAAEDREVRASLRDVSVQLALLNHQVRGHLELKGTDLECLDLISRDGPLSPSTLARRTGLRPATLTGILDRLERGGWIARERDPADRRAVLIRAERGRVAEVLGLYSGMNSAMDQDSSAGTTRRSWNSSQASCAGPPRAGRGPGPRSS